MHLIAKRSSLVSQAVTILRDGITSGLWVDFMPSEMALCERLQVSRVTLRAALSQLQREGWCLASQGRRRRINAPHVQANQPPGNTVVLLSPLPLQSLPASAIFWIDGLRNHLASADFQLEVVSNHAAFGKQPDRALESILHEKQPAAWVLYLSTPAQQQWFCKTGLPCLVSGSCHPGVRLTSVDVDYGAACEHAVSMLVSKGRRHLALLMPRSQQAGNLESERGFAEQSRKLGVDFQVAHHDGTVPGICGMLDRLLRLAEPVNGIVIAKPAHVVTAISHLSRRGVKLPQDIAVISRDDDPLLEHLVPAVARYHTQPEAFVRKISRAVVDLVQVGSNRPRECRLMPTFLKGETLG